MTKSLINFLEDHIKQHPEKHSLQFISEKGCESLTDETLLTQAQELARHLNQCGFQPKDRAILLGENSLPWMICYLAVLYARGVVVTLDTELLADSTASLIKKMDASIIFCSEMQFGKIALMTDLLTPVIKMQSTNNMVNALNTLPNIAHFIESSANYDYDEQVASIVNSSGTGGKLKGILLSHQNIIDVVSFYKKEFSANGIKNILCILPCFAIYPCSINLAALANGIPVYFVDIKKTNLLTALQNYPIHCLPLVPLGIAKIHEEITHQVTKKGKVVQTMFFLLTKLSLILRRYGNLNFGNYFFAAIHRALGDHLEVMLTGGAPLNPAITKDFYGWGYTIKEGYGLTETAGVITVTDGKFSSIGSCGKPLFDVNISIDSPNQEGCGEILIKSSRLMVGYFRDPEANSNALTGKVFHTGDLGRIDRKGNLHIIGRSKEVIIHSDERKTLPQDVEIRYQHLRGIEQLAVIGIPDPITNCDLIHAAIVPNEQLLKQYNDHPIKIKKYLENLVFQRAAELPVYLRIVAISIFSSLPTNALGKIKRMEIKEKILHKTDNDKI